MPARCAPPGPATPTFRCSRVSNAGDHPCCSTALPPDPALGRPPDRHPDRLRNRAGVRLLLWPRPGVRRSTNPASTPRPGRVRRGRFTGARPTAAGPPPPYRALTELQTQLQRRLPAPPIISQCRRLVAVIVRSRGQPTPSPSRHAPFAASPPTWHRCGLAGHPPLGTSPLHRIPYDAEIHADGVLAPVARDIDAARGWSARTPPGDAAEVTVPGRSLRPCSSLYLMDFSPLRRDPSYGPAPDAPPPDLVPQPGSRTSPRRRHPAARRWTGGDARSPCALPWFTARLVEWELQLAPCAAGRGVWDQRGHGRPAGPRCRRTIARTGRDSGQVLDASPPPDRSAGRPLDGRDERDGPGRSARAVRTASPALLLGTSAGVLVGTVSRARRKLVLLLPCCRSTCGCCTGRLGGWAAERSAPRHVDGRGDPLCSSLDDADIDA